jgi:hypothetical protein
MRIAGTLCILSLLTVLFSLPGFAGGFMSIGLGAGTQKADLSVAAETSAVTYHPTSGDVKIGLTVGKKLAVFGVVIANSFTVGGTDIPVSVQEGSRVVNGFTGVGASYNLMGENKGLYVTGGVGKVFWQQKDLQDDPFQGNGSYIGAGLYVGNNVSLEVDYIKGKTTGTVGSSTFATDTRTYVGTVNVRF